MDMTQKFLAVVGAICFIIMGATGVYALDADSVLGTWKVESQDDKATQVEIYKCDDKYCGKFSWLEDPESLDTKNPDESKRSQKLLGMNFVWGFEFDDDEWSDGNIYDPRSGKTYDCKMWFEDDNMDVLNVKGYILFIGKTSIWYRVK